MIVINVVYLSITVVRVGNHWRGYATRRRLWAPSAVDQERLCLVIV